VTPLDVSIPLASGSIWLANRPLRIELAAKGGRREDDPDVGGENQF